MSMDVYAWADSLIDSSPRYATGFTELLAARPYPVSPVVRRLYESRLLLIRSFQQIALGIFRAALNGEMHPVVLHWLMNETPDCVGLCYHRNLEDRHFTLPVFFRTDEVKPGRIIEIQCPECGATITSEPDAEDLFCQECEKATMKNPLVKLGLI